MSMSKLPAVFALALAVLAGCIPAGDGQQGGPAPNTSPAPLPLESKEAWVPPTISTDSLRQRLIDDPTTVVVDVRGFESFKAEHIRGARNVPYAEVEKRWKELPKDRTIVLYCA